MPRSATTHHLSDPETLLGIAPPRHQRLHIGGVPGHNSQHKGSPPHRSTSPTIHPASSPVWSTLLCPYLPQGVLRLGLRSRSSGIEEHQVDFTEQSRRRFKERPPRFDLDYSSGRPRTLWLSKGSPRNPWLDRGGCNSAPQSLESDIARANSPPRDHCREQNKRR